MDGLRASNPGLALNRSGQELGPTLPGRRVWYPKAEIENGCNPKSGRQTMPLRNRHGIWNSRFKLDGKEYSGTTDLVATKQNMRAAQDKESERRQKLREGRKPSRPIQVREFNDAVRSFLEWAKIEYRAHPTVIVGPLVSPGKLKDPNAVRFFSAREAKISQFCPIEAEEARNVSLD